MARTAGARASRFGALGFTFLALVLTVLTAFLLAHFIGSSKYANEPLTEVVVAAADIPASERIKEEHLRVVKWPQSTIPEGAFSSVDEVLGPKPSVPTNKILKGEPILKRRLADAKLGTGMASLVPLQLRAFPVPIDNWIAEARLVYPGAVVDVLTTISTPGDRRVSTKLVLQAIKVLAVNGSVDPSDAIESDENASSRRGGISKAVVTLLVNPEQAEALALASREGKIDVMLRNAGDKGIVETMGIDPPELLGEVDPDELEEALADQQKVESAVAKNKKRRRSRSRRRYAPAENNPEFGPGDRRPASSGSGRTKTINLGAQ